MQRQTQPPQFLLHQGAFFEAAARHSSTAPVSPLPRPRQSARMWRVGPRAKRDQRQLGGEPAAVLLGAVVSPAKKPAQHSADDRCGKPVAPLVALQHLTSPSDSVQRKVRSPAAFASSRRDRRAGPIRGIIHEHQQSERCKFEGCPCGTTP
jgi:hypothetical protein